MFARIDQVHAAGRGPLPRYPPFFGFSKQRGRPVAKLVRAKPEKAIDRSALIDEITAFSKTCKVGRINLRKLVAEGRD